MPYDIEEHKHRFAAWAAGRAASVKRCRFTVEQAKAIIEAVGLHRFIENPGTLPAPAAVDVQHRLWRKTSRLWSIS